jgi:hypothetical protein
MLDSQFLDFVSEVTVMYHHKDLLEQRGTVLPSKDHNRIGHHLLDRADYVMDLQGNIKSVILDYRTFRILDEVLLDYGLGKAMEEAEDDEEFSLETIKSNIKGHYVASCIML